MKIIIIGSLVYGLIYLPMKLLNSHVLPELKAISAIYSNADQIAQSVAAE